MGLAVRLPDPTCIRATQHSDFGERHMFPGICLRPAARFIAIGRRAVASMLA